MDFNLIARAAYLVCKIFKKDAEISCQEIEKPEKGLTHYKISIYNMTEYEICIEKYYNKTDIKLYKAIPIIDIDKDRDFLEIINIEKVSITPKSYYSEDIYIKDMNAFIRFYISKEYVYSDSKTYYIIIKESFIRKLKYFFLKNMSARIQREALLCLDKLIGQRFCGNKFSGNHQSFCQCLPLPYQQ